MAPLTVFSDNRKTQLSIEDTTGKILDVESGQVLGSIDLHWTPVLAAISNNQKNIAAVFRSIFSDIYLYRKEGERWSMQYLKRMPKHPETLAWEEASEPGYPPTELQVRTESGTITFLPDGQ